MLFRGQYVVIATLTLLTVNLHCRIDGQQFPLRVRSTLTLTEALDEKLMEPQIMPRIVGGTPVMLGQYPSFGIGASDTKLCAGTLM